MNVTRTRRRLRAQRVYTNRYRLPGQRHPAHQVDGLVFDSRAALVLVGRLAHRKYRTALHGAVRSGLLPDRYVDDCGGWTDVSAPCGGCDRCIAEHVYHYLIGPWRERAFHATAMARGRAWRR